MHVLSPCKSFLEERDSDESRNAVGDGACLSCNKASLAFAAILNDAENEAKGSETSSADTDLWRRVSRRTCVGLSML